MSDPSENEPREPKIIIDEDWKEQVAREKREAGSEPPRTDPAPPSGDQSADPELEPTVSAPAESDATADVRPDAAAPDAGTPDAAAGGNLPNLPPASFQFLVSMLFTQAMSFLGQIPDPESGQTRVDKAMARHTIDTLDVLTEKTRGNLTEDEDQMLREALHALRLAYVSVKSGD